MLREIACKTLVGRGKENSSFQKNIFINEYISKTLGCWIINLKYETEIKGKKVILKGSFDIQIWYAENNNQKSEVYVETVEFLEDINIGYRDVKTLNDVIYPAVYINKYPTCVSMDLKDNKEIDLKIEALFYIEVFQEAVVVVDCKEDYQEELSLEEEIALNVNPKYIENKDEN